MRRGGVFWTIAVGCLILLAYIVPFTFMTDVRTWYGSFLFWTVIGALIIFANVMLTKGWGDGDES